MLVTPAVQGLAAGYGSTSSKTSTRQFVRQTSVESTYRLSAVCVMRIRTYCFSPRAESACRRTKGPPRRQPVLPQQALPWWLDHRNSANAKSPKATLLESSPTQHGYLGIQVLVLTYLWTLRGGAKSQYSRWQMGEE